MKKVFALLILFSSVSLWAQKGNHLETIYFRNPQYVLQMDKMMYPGYNLKFENIILHEYLNNKKISTTPLKMPARKITFTNSDGSNNYIRKLKTYPSFQEYILAVATWTSAVDSNAVDFDQELYDNYRIAWEKTDWEEALYYVEEPKDFVIEAIKEENEIYNDDNFVPEGFNEFFFDYTARLDENYNIKEERIYLEEIARNDEYFNLKRLLPVKAQNLADSLLSNYKKVEVRKRPVYDKKRRPIGTEATAGDVQVYERGYFDILSNRVILAGRENSYLYQFEDASIFIDEPYIKKGILNRQNHQHLEIPFPYDYYFLDDDAALPYESDGNPYELRTNLDECFHVLKEIDSFDDAIIDPFNILLVGCYDGSDNHLDDPLIEEAFMNEKETIRLYWDATPLGEYLRLPNRISYGLNSSNLPLVEHLIESRPLQEDEVFDADGNVYETTLIGDRRWMKENLRSEHFQDGSEIPNLTTSQWATSTNEGIIIDEEMDVTLANKGHRYNGYTVVSEKNVCPYGFYVPDEDDIAELYNDVTPYNEYIKIKGNGTVKEFRYSPLLAPIVWPVATALNVAWNSIALGADITLVAGAVAIDLTYNTPWFLADLCLLGPILGWKKTNDKQYAKQMAPYRKKLYSIYKAGRAYDPLTDFPSIRISQEGYMLHPHYRKLFLDKKGQPIRIQEHDYADAKMCELDDDDNAWSTWDYDDSIDKPKYNPEWKNKNPKKGLVYNPLPTFKGNSGLYLSEGSVELVSEFNGFFHYFRSSAYRPKSQDDYREFESKMNKSGMNNKKSRYLPVLTQLLKKDERFKDNYGFNLRENNYIEFPSRKKSHVPAALRNAKLKSYNNIGLVYNHWGTPNMWGDHRELFRLNHELNAAPLYYPEDDFKLLKMSTSIRCVNDPFYEAPSDKY